jgi:hypothetical protein
MQVGQDPGNIECIHAAVATECRVPVRRDTLARLKLLRTSAYL